MNSWWDTLTEAERAAVLLTLGPDESFLYRSVSTSQLSIMRHWLGGMVNGKKYVYLPPHDELVRKDVLQLVESMRKTQRAKAKQDVREAAKVAQLGLL